MLSLAASVWVSVDKSAAKLQVRSRLYCKNVESKSLDHHQHKWKDVTVLQLTGVVSKFTELA